MTNRFLLGAAVLAASLGCVHPNTDVDSSLAPLHETSTGDRIRVWHRSPCCQNPLIGLADSTTNDALWLKSERDAAELAVPNASITRVDKWVPVHHEFLPFAVGGIAAGAAFGLALEVFIKSLSPRNGDFSGYRTRFVLGGGALGLIAGAIASGLENARWERAAPPSTGQPQR